MADPADKTQRAKQQAIVDVTDDTGRVVDRTAFENDGDAEQYAAAEQARGLKATVSSLDPKPESADLETPPVPRRPL